MSLAESSQLLSVLGLDDPIMYSRVVGVCQASVNCTGNDCLQTLEQVCVHVDFLCLTGEQSYILQKMLHNTPQSDMSSPDCGEFTIKLICPVKCCVNLNKMLLLPFCCSQPFSIDPIKHDRDTGKSNVQTRFAVQHANLPLHPKCYTLNAPMCSSA